MNKLKKIQEKLKSDKIDAIFITSPYNISYLTGTFPSTIEEREYYILITKNNNYLMAPQMFMMAVKNRTSDFSYVEITGRKGLYENIKELLNNENLKTLGFEKENLLYREFEHLDDLKNIELIPLENFIENERRIKSNEEIEKIKKACEITDKCFDYVLRKINLGITEKELKSEIEFFLNKFGGNAFSPIVAFGENASVPHHIAGDQKLSSNSFVLLDFGAKYEGYCSDMSRTIFFGKPSEKEIKLYNTVLEAQEMALNKLGEWERQDFEVSHLQNIAESHIEKNGFPAFPHSLGHGVGLQVHEEPSVSKFSEGNDLKQNMVITIEPGIYDLKTGGVRIEDVVLVTKNGYEILTKSEKKLTILD